MKNNFDDRPVVDITRDDVSAMIDNTNGRFFSVKFVKGNGQVRVLTGRTKVTKGLVGGKDTTKHLPKYKKVWDRNIGAYRNVNVETVYEILTKGKIFVVTD